MRLILLLLGLALIREGLLADRIPGFDNSTTAPTDNSTISQTVAKVEPSVVMVIGYKQNSQTNDSFGFFPPSVEVTEGTGFVVADSGTILTNKHVVEDSGENFKVITSTGLKYSVTNIYRDPDDDVAVVKIDPNEHKENKLMALELGSSTDISMGETVIAVSDRPGRVKPTAATGQIIGVQRVVVAGDYQSGEAERLHNAIQTNLSLIPGNSGSPLMNKDGKVVGINTATSSGPISMSFALPIDTAKDFLNSVSQ